MTTTNKILNPDETYTFSKFFDLKIPGKSLALEFGYSFERKRLDLPQYSGVLDRIEQTRDRINEILPYVSLSNEASRREWLISPVLYDLIHYTKVEIQIEYPIKISNQLQGVIDYFLESKQNMLIIEAKKEDLELGMAQLIAELIALDQWQIEDRQPVLLGAVTTGKIWEFARLNRQAKHIEQGLEDYRVPDDLHLLLRILIQSVHGECS